MKAICVINTSGNYGGAEKRVVSLFEHINNDRKDFILIINKALYELMTEKGVLSSEKRVSIISIPFDNRNFSFSNKVLQATGNNSAKQNQVKIRLGRYKYFLKTVFQWLIFLKQLNTILSNNNITIVYTIWQGGIWGRTLFKKKNIRIIYGANSNLVWHIEKNLLDRFDSQYRIIRDANHIDFLSEGLVTELKSIMPSCDFPENYTVSPCSFIDYKIFYPDSSKENSVVFMGRLVALKNPLLFLETVKLFNSKYHDYNKITFYVLGIGPEENKMKRYVNENNIGNVVFKGKISNPEEYLKRSKVFISIQQTENYPGQALIEAMACENAIIASNVGETQRLVTENEGELVRLDANDIADALITLYSNEAALSLKGENARKKVITEHTIECFKEYFYNIMKD